MAINYTTLFGDLADVVEAIEEIEAMMVTTEARKATMITQFDASGVTDLVSNINTAFSNFQDQFNDMVQQLVDLATVRITDRETVLEELPKITSVSVTNVLMALIADMITNAETIKESTLTLTPNATVATNTNVGELIYSAILPGDTNPGTGFKTSPSLAGELSEMSLDDDVLIICSDDSQGSTSVGEEQFVVTGNVPTQQFQFANNQGGNQGTGDVSVGDNLLTNFFETFTATDVPDGWTVNTGTVTTDYKEGVTAIKGSASLEFPSGAAINTELEYDNFYDLLVPGQLLCVYYWIQRSAGATGTIDLDIVINSSSVYAGSHVMGAAYDTWSLESGVFIVPDNIGLAADTSFKLSLAAGIAVNEVFIDGGGVTQMTQFGGLGFHVVAGEDLFLLNDVFSLTVANDDAGKFARFFTRAFGVQLPSTTSASETITEPT